MQDDLDTLFAAARRTQAEPSAEFLARILADAEAVQDGWHGSKAAPRGWRWPRIVALMLGGVGATAGMATAALAGMWIGFAQPEAVTVVTGAWLTDQRVDLIPTYDFLTEQ